MGIVCLIFEPCLRNFQKLHIFLRSSKVITAIFDLTDLGKCHLALASRASDPCIGQVNPNSVAAGNQTQCLAWHQQPHQPRQNGIQSTPGGVYSATGRTLGMVETHWRPFLAFRWFPIHRPSSNSTVPLAMDYSISSGLITPKGFFQVQNHKEYQNVVIISFVHFEKINIFCFMH